MQALVSRFSRQLLISEIGLSGQTKISKTSVLIVGSGGLGAPASMYLVGAGIGKLGIVDHDFVTISNLHRQVIHAETRVGMSKVESAKIFLSQLNSTSQIETHDTLLSTSNAMAIIEPYDIVLDCTDNVMTRYLINDACVLLKKPLVSASALKFEGHLTVYNFGPEGPCYRCLFPEAPPASSVANCNEAGIVGPVTGILGSLQALEALKIILGNMEVLSGKMVIFDGTSSTFRNVKLRNRSAKCELCGDSPSITKLLDDYGTFCGIGHQPNDDPSIAVVAGDEFRISCEDYKNEILDQDIEHLLIDVREENQFNICHLDEAVNIPFSQLPQRVHEIPRDWPLYLICRFGITSQKALVILQQNGFKNIKDIRGGITEWSRKIDPSIPIY